jgi:hypothetical protein
VVFQPQTAGTVSSQVLLGQLWTSAFQAPFSEKDANGHGCSSSNETSTKLLWSKDGSTFNSSEHRGAKASFVPGTGATVPIAAFEFLAEGRTTSQKFAEDGASSETSE